MAEAALPQNAAAIDTSAIYEPSLFGTYSKKIGMWLFLLSDSLTFGAFAVRLQLRTHLHLKLADAVSTREHRQCHHHDRVPVDQFASPWSWRSMRRHVETTRPGSFWLLATHGVRARFYRSPRQGMEQSDHRGSPPTHLPGSPEPAGCVPKFVDVSKTVPQFAATFFGLTGMHMLHVYAGSGLSRCHCACGVSSSRFFSRSGWWRGWRHPLTVHFTMELTYC